ncbi:MAG: hypothetical protein ACTHU0_15080 [Kofleriaceae bacterium]
MLLVHAACGGTSKPAQTAPQPAEPKTVEPPPAEPTEPATAAASATAAEPAEPAELAEPAERGEPADPNGPIEHLAPNLGANVKLVSKGKGTLAPLRYSATLGSKQQVEVAMNLAVQMRVGGQLQKQVVPTHVLIGEVETKGVEENRAEYVFTVAGLDWRDLPGSLPAADFKALGAPTGLVISGAVGPFGLVGNTTLRSERSTPTAESALKLVRGNLPSWPVLPNEPVGVGAKWKTTTTWWVDGAGGVTQVTDYDVVSRSGATWTIKGKTKISGALTGTGTTEATITDGALYPSFKTTTETRSPSKVDGPVQFKSGWTVTAK